MAKIDSLYGSGVLPAPIPVAQEVLSAKAKVTLTALQVALGNVVTFVVLPADCVPVGYVINADDLDSGTPALTFDFGLLNEDETAIETALVSNSTLAQAGGLLLHTASKAAYDLLSGVAADDVDRMVGIIFDVAAGTAQAGDIEVELLYKAV
jgi:hypothetical protein